MGGGKGACHAGNGFIQQVNSIKFFEGQFFKWYPPGAPDACICCSPQLSNIVKWLVNGGYIHFLNTFQSDADIPVVSLVFIFADDLENIVIDEIAC